MRSTVLLLCAAVLFTAFPSGAAKVVNVRVGQHAEYDRIVFDLDGWAAYQVHSVTGNEIRVRVLAETEARKITAEKGLVRSVTVTPAAQGSEVVIRLYAVDVQVQVKDMMLQSPSRIVIDVRKVKPVAAATPPPATPKPVAKPAPAATPAPAPEPVAEVPAPTKMAEAPSAPVKPTPAPTATPEPSPAPVAKPPVAAQEAPVVTAPKPGAVAKTPVPTPRPVAKPAPIKKAPVTQQKPAPAPKRIVKKSAPAPKPAAASPGFDLRLVGAGVLILLVGVVGFIWHRRRSAGADFDDSEDAAIDGDWFGDASETAVQDEDSELPIPVEHRDVALSVSDTSSSDDDELPISIEQADEVTKKEKQPTFFDSAAESSPLDSGAETAVMDQTHPSRGQESVGFAAGLATSEGMVPLSQYQELEERLHKLESRFTDIDAARERLEQQGVNQTEELRVQRAAIARTQRVLRTLTRPEEEVSDEPAPKG